MRGRPTEDTDIETLDKAGILSGVTVPWLQKAFGMGRGAVEKKLRGCPTIGTGKNRTPLYDLKDAAAYLVTPKIDLDSYLRTVKPQQLPEHLRDAIWSARLKEQKWMEKAGDLWRTDLIREMIADVLQNIRTKLQILPDTAEREAGLSEEQFDAVQRVVEDLQDDVYKMILNLRNVQKTPNTATEYRQLHSEPRDNDDLI